MSKDTILKREQKNLIKKGEKKDHFFFLIGKENYNKQKEETSNQCPLGIQGVYKSSPQARN